MKETRILMGMPVTVEVVADSTASSAAPARDLQADINAAFDYFTYVDEKFSTYKETSEITAINKGLLKPDAYSADMKEVFELCEKTKKETEGYFDIVTRDGSIDPSGLVKGWAIYNAVKLLEKRGVRNFFVDAGGDIQVAGVNSKGAAWTVGIANPFKKGEIVKVLHLKDGGVVQGVATSGTYVRGQHIYNPHDKTSNISDIVSLTVVGPNIYEADRFATAAFAMGKKGIYFIQNLAGFEGYMIDSEGLATMTDGFEKYVK